MKRLEIKNCSMILIEKLQKYQHYHQVKLINMNILQVKKFLITPFNQSQVIKQATFAYSLLGKAFEKQIKTPEDLFLKNGLKL